MYKSQVPDNFHYPHQSNGRTTKLRGVAGIMFPSFQVLNIEIGFQSLQTDFGYQALSKV